MRRAPLVLAGVLLAGCGGKARLKLGAAPEGEVVEAVGEVMNDPANPEDTKKRSLVDAQKKAVEMVVGLHLSAKTMVDKSVLIQSNVLARSDGYVRKYDVLKEWLEAPLYKTRIRAYVSTRQIADDLKALGLLKEPQVGYPRIAVVLSETAPGTELADPTSPASDAMAQALLNKGYRVVERDAALSVKAEGSESDPSRARRLGRVLDAEVLVFGSAQASLFEANAFGGLVSYRATLNVRAYQAKTGDLLLTASKIAPGLEASRDGAALKALSNAGEQAGSELADRLARQLAERAFAQVTVTGVADLNRLQAVERALRGAPGAGDVYLRSFESGEARLDVQLRDGSAADVAASLEKDPSSKVKVLSMTQNTIQARQQP